MLVLIPVFCFLSVFSSAKCENFPNEQSPSSCSYPGSPSNSKTRFLPSSDLSRHPYGSVVFYECEPGFELIGPSKRTCGSQGVWHPQGIPFCVINVALGKAAMQSFQETGGKDRGRNDDGDLYPLKAVDGLSSLNYDTCTTISHGEWWYVNLLQIFVVQLVRMDLSVIFKNENVSTKDEEGVLVSIDVRVGNTRPDRGANPICNKFEGRIFASTKIRPLFLPCNPPLPGAFVSIHVSVVEGSSKSSVHSNLINVCEVFVYSDQAYPVENCPSFRDVRPGHTHVYNGKCFILYDSEPKTFMESIDFCKSRGGTLIDETSPPFQGYLSWHLWSLYTNVGQQDAKFWIGIYKSDERGGTSWKWISGLPVSTSFWSLPGGRGQCAQIDGSRNWLWTDQNCDVKSNFICQHPIRECGKPDQPPNSTLIMPKVLTVGSSVEYVCDVGSTLIGPSTRTCLPSAVYSQFPPLCRFVECGPPPPIPNGDVRILPSSHSSSSSSSPFAAAVLAEYVCHSNNASFILVGDAHLICDVSTGIWTSNHRQPSNYLTSSIPTSSPLPRCHEVPHHSPVVSPTIRCDDPPPYLPENVAKLSKPVNEAGEFQNFSVGDEVRYRCVDPPHHVLTYQCLESGMWNVSKEEDHSNLCHMTSFSEDDFSISENLIDRNSFLVESQKEVIDGPKLLNVVQSKHSKSLHETSTSKSESPPPIVADTASTKANFSISNNPGKLLFFGIFGTSVLISLLIGVAVFAYKRRRRHGQSMQKCFPFAGIDVAKSQHFVSQSHEDDGSSSSCNVPVNNRSRSGTSTDICGVNSGSSDVGGPPNGGSSANVKNRYSDVGTFDEEISMKSTLTST